MHYKSMHSYFIDKFIYHGYKLMKYNPLLRCLLNLTVNNIMVYSYLVECLE